MRTLLASTAVALAASSASAARAADVTFPFDDERLLQPEEREGGLAHVAPGAGSEAPLVVWLHGVNEKGPLHRGLGSPGFDLRAIVDELADASSIAPPIVAGPSQTRDAWTGSRLWSTFDLDAFVEEVEVATGTKVDRGRVVLVGHSGAGCNPSGGLLSPMHEVKPLAILALDTCMDERFGKLLATAADVAPVHVVYQNAIWPREFDAFERVFKATLAEQPGRQGTFARVDAPGANPHDEVVPVALRRMLPKLLPPPADEE